MQIRLAIVGLFCLFLVSSCTKNEDVALIRLDQQLFSAKSPDSVRALLNRNQAVSQLYFNANGAGNDTALVHDLTNRVNNPALNELNNQIQAEFGDMADLKKQLAEAFTNIKKDFPDFKAPKVATIVTGFLGPDLVVTDSLIVIGIDYFAGPKAKYRPPGTGVSAIHSSPIPERIHRSGYCLRHLRQIQCHQPGRPNDAGRYGVLWQRICIHKSNAT